MVSKVRVVIISLMTIIALLMMLCVLFSGHIITANMTMNNQFTGYSLLKYLLLGLILLVLSTCVIMLSRKYDKLVKGILWVVIISIVLFAMLVQPYAPVYDSMGVNSQVYGLVHNFPNGKWSNYFSIFPNNVPITTFLFWVDMPLRHFLTGLEEYLYLNAVYGQLLIVFSIYHMSKLSNKMFGNATRNVLLLFYIFVPTYLMQFTQIGYSDTFSLPFLVAGIRYLIDLFYDVNNDQTDIIGFSGLGIKRVKAIVFSSIFLALALFLRPNTIVVILASAIIIGLFFWRQWRLLIVLLVALSLSTVVLKQAGKVTQEATKYQVSHDKDLQMPIESWFLTGYYLGGRSGDEINAITDKYKKYDQRKAYIRSKLFGKLKSLGVVGILKTWRDKTNVLFGIKSDFGMQYFKAFRNHGNHGLQEQYLRNYNYLVPKMIHSTMTVTVLSILSFGILPIYLWLRHREALFNHFEDSKQQTFSLIAVLGVFESLTLFYVLLWEVQEHYIYMMFPFLLFIGAALWQWTLNKVTKSIPF
ncbi:hypothetical protein LNP18_06320 [Leuconostoc citreum]|uniref:hypothetical protein n=1 Tax=Leuconostoc citreum TaxID=33964 RepID=UPI00200B361A|nr:hypothetical protein [Leuconostoc citreum]MCK8605718.1 hypothetical protein [Leuconostoc citreum]